mgnify:CR=1 FL=1
MFTSASGIYTLLGIGVVIPHSRPIPRAHCRLDPSSEKPDDCFLT